MYNHNQLIVRKRASRQQDPKAIRQQNQELQQMLERISDGFYALDASYTVMYFNHQAEVFLSRKREEVLGRNLWACFPEAYGTSLYTNFRKALNEQLQVTFSLFYPPLQLWFEITAHPSPEGLSVFFRDMTEQRLSKEALLLANERFRLAAKNDAIYDWDIAANLLTWGDGLEKLFGYRPEEMQMHQWALATHPDDQPQVLQQLSMSLQEKTQTQWQAEYQFQHKQGHYCYISERGHIVRDAEGNATRFVGVMQDITARKQEEFERRAYETKIKQQHMQITSILEQMQQGFYALDKDLHVQYWNKLAETITGISRDEVLGKRNLILYGKAAQEMYLPVFQQVLQSQANWHSEHICPQVGKWIEMSVYPVNEGLSVFFKEIDDRKKLEVEMQRLSMLAKGTSNGVSLVESDFTISWVNEAFTKITGYQEAEALGCTHNVLLGGFDTNPVVVQQLESAFSLGQPFQVELLLYIKSKEARWFEVIAQPMLDTHGQVQRYFVIHIDITGRKNLETALQQEQLKTHAAVIAAQEKERTQIGRELHDNVNQVLTSVKLYQELCLMDDRNHKDLAIKSAALLQQAIDEIRNLSKRLSAPTLGDIRLKDSVQELVNTIAVTRQFEIELDCAVIEELELAQDIHLALYRILQEHLTNILKYAQASRVEVAFDLEDGLLLLKVSDNGKGFNQLKKRNGIGITNMTMRAESLNGTLKVNSAPGQGCTLTAAIPLSA